MFEDVTEHMKDLSKAAAIEARNSLIESVSGDISKAEAIRLAESGAWKMLLPKERAALQLCQSRLFMPFDEFHAAVEDALGRPVWTHEFAQPQTLKDEMAGVIDMPNMAAILGKIPKDKRVVVVVK